MTTDLPVRLPRKNSSVAPSHTRRAGLFVGLAMLLATGFSAYGLGWLALASAFLPVMVGAASAGVVETGRRAGKSWDSSIPMGVSGAAIGATLGAMLMPLWAAAAATGSGVGLGYLLAAGAGLGAATGATAGVATGMTRKAKDPIGSAAGAAAGTLGASLLGHGTGIFAAGCALLGGWLGFDAGTLSQALAYAPTLLGALGISVAAAAGAFGGTLAIHGAEARERQFQLPDPSSFPSWARSDSVTGFHRENRTLYIG